jgi:membrane associated rhomboid family serine protease
LYGRGHRQYEVRFGPPHTPDIIKTLLLVNVGVFLLQILLLRTSLGGAFHEAFWLRPEAFWTSGALWQPFTYMWLHSPGSLTHVGFNMLGLWMFGSPLAEAWGPQRFLRFYLTCGVGAGLLIATLPALPVLLGLGMPPTYALPTLGASGAIYGVLLAYSLTWPDRTLMLLFPPIPIKALYFIPFLFLVEFLFGPPNLSHVGHLGGVLVGWVLFRRQSRLPLLPSKNQILLRWRRYKMRRQLREVRRDQYRPWRDDDSRLH